MRNFFKNIKAKIIRAAVLMQEKRGENFVDSGIKILIAVVIGALLLGGLYALFGDTIMPTVTEKVGICSISRADDRLCGAVCRDFTFAWNRLIHGH